MRTHSRFGSRLGFAACRTCDGSGVASTALDEADSDELIARLEARLTEIGARIAIADDDASHVATLEARGWTCIPPDPMLGAGSVAPAAGRRG